jgi:hypothetical protein
MMPGPQHADPERSHQVAREQMAWLQETPPPLVGTVFETNGAPRVLLDGTGEKRTLAKFPSDRTVVKSGRPDFRRILPTSGQDYGGNGDNCKDGAEARSRACPRLVRH